jgi:hypothetical protein
MKAKNERLAAALHKRDELERRRIADVRGCEERERQLHAQARSAIIVK